MKLYEVPRGTMIRVRGDVGIPPDSKEIEANDVLKFSHVDGMYSLCFDSKGEMCHLAAWTEVDIISPKEQEFLKTLGKL